MITRRAVTLKDGTTVFAADGYLDLRARCPDPLRRAEAAGRVRVQRERGDLGELIVLVDRQVEEARRR